MSESFRVADMPEWQPGDLNKVDKACERFLRVRERIDTPIDWTRVRWIPKIPGTPPPAQAAPSTDSWYERSKAHTTRSMHAHFKSMHLNRPPRKARQ
jgi:hypothetical protein